MKRILIAGEGSYIGTGVERYLQEYNKVKGQKYYEIHTVSQRNDNWKQHDFSGYDAVFCVTGIAHVDTGSVREEEKKLYYKVNCDLAVETAKKAKAEGVGQFIYMSSIIVYGDSAKVGERKHITADTKPQPANFYGDSKLQAEKQLLPLEEEGFCVAILRPPFVYGKGCKGNYVMLAKLAKLVPIFPNIRNERSMLYIENLCEFVRLLVESKEGGIFFPQNNTQASTSEMVAAIAQGSGKKIHLWSILNPLVCLASKCPGRIGQLVNKAFGSLTYDQSMSKAFEGYRMYDLQESILRTQSGE